MTMGKEIRSRQMARDSQFKYLPDLDRYLLAGVQPRYKFNIIGAGIMGQEHIRVTYLEGRLKAWEKQDFMTNFELSTHLEISCGESKPSRHIEPGYPSWIENSGHNGATYYEHVHFIDNIDGMETSTATAQEGLWSVIVALAAQQSIEQGQVVDIDEYLASENVTL
jgi:myo-inositol 2-dehydrogenase/D-chiro-inositol 1-dehydrogenase